MRERQPSEGDNILAGLCLRLEEDHCGIDGVTLEDNGYDSHLIRD